MTDLVTGDTGSKLIVTCRDNETNEVIDLTGATVKLRWEGDAGVIEKTMTVTNAAAGIAQYQFLAGEIIVPAMRFEVEITDSGGAIISSLGLIELVVREQIG